MNGNQIVYRTIVMKGTSEGLDKVAADLNKVATAHTGVTLAAEKTEKSHLSLEQTMTRQTLRLDEVARAQNKIAQEKGIADKLLKAELIDQQRHNELMTLATQRYGAAATATKGFAQQTGLARHELINLGRQAQDVGVSLASGQSPLMVLVQQGTQIADVFATSGGTVRGFFSQAAGWAGRFAASTAGVVTGIGAIAAGALYVVSSWQDGQKEIDRALLGIGKSARTTRGEINEMAEANASAAKLSVSEWEAGAAAFAKTGNIHKSNFQGLNELVKGFAVTIGESSSEAQKELAKIFSGDVTSAADALNAKFGSISGATREYARDLEVAGKRQEGFAVLIRDVSVSTREAAATAGFFATAWDNVANSASNAFTAVSKTLAAMTGIGDTKTAKLARTETMLSTAELGFSQQQELALKIGPELVPGLLEAEKAVMKLRQEVAALKTELGRVDETNVFLKMGREADDAVRKLLPHIDKLKDIEELQRKIREGQTQQHPDDGPGTQQGLGVFNQEALNRAKVMEDTIKSTAEQLARADAIGLQLKATYGTHSIEAAKTLDALKDQLSVASAVGGKAKLQAEEQAKFNELLRQGVHHEDALRIAAAEREVKQAQINTQAKETLASLQDQHAVAAAIGEDAKIAAQAQATYNALIRQGVDAQIAGAIAAQQASNAYAQLASAAAEKNIAINKAAAETLYKLQLQRPVSEALTNDARLRAEKIATQNTLMAEGVNSELAMAIATEQEYQARARISAQVKEQAHMLRQQTELIEASTKGVSKQEQAILKAGQAYENAIRSGASASAASELAGATQANELAKLAEERAQANRNAAQQLEREVEAMNALVEASNRLRAALSFVPTIALGLGGGTQDLFQSKQGGYSQFNPAGYTSTTNGTLIQALTWQYGPGGFDMTTGAPNAQGRAYVFNKMSGGGVTQSTISSAIGGGLMNQPLGLFADKGTATIDTAQISLIQRAIETLPKEQQAASYRELLGAAQSLPGSLEKVELVQSLTQKLEQLTQATEANTSATQTMTDVLSPFYSSDPRRTHLGFRAFASGGIMTEDGMLPLRQYQGGGMATSPQVAVFGEGSTPEAYVPVPSGRIPVEIKTPANSNRPVNVTINVHGNADANTVAALKSTAFQQAQAMRRMIG